MPRRCFVWTREIGLLLSNPWFGKQGLDWWRFNESLREPFVNKIILKWIHTQDYSFLDWNTWWCVEFGIHNLRTNIQTREEEYYIPRMEQQKNWRRGQIRIRIRRIKEILKERNWILDLHVCLLLRYWRKDYGTLTRCSEAVGLSII